MRSGPITGGESREGDKMIRILKIRINDDPKGRRVIIGAQRVSDPDEGAGYYLAASNGANIAHYEPQSLDKCIADAWESWANWRTVKSCFAHKFQKSLA